MAKATNWKNRIVGEGEQVASQRRRFGPTHVVYALVDPRDAQPHYVGLTRNMRYRLYKHLRDKDASPIKVAWLDSLRADGLSPEVKILAESWADDVAAIEVYWIAKGRELGWPLTNATNGGEGAHGNARKPPNFDYLRPLLSESAWQVFETLPVLTRFDVCQTAAIAAMQHSMVVAHAFGYEWRGLRAQSDACASVAEQAVYAAQSGKFEQLAEQVRRRSEAMEPRLAAYQAGLLAAA